MTRRRGNSQAIDKSKTSTHHDEKQQIADAKFIFECLQQVPTEVVVNINSLAIARGCKERSINNRLLSIGKRWPDLKLKGILGESPSAAPSKEVLGVETKKSSRALEGMTNGSNTQTRRTGPATTKVAKRGKLEDDIDDQSEQSTDTGGELDSDYQEPPTKSTIPRKDYPSRLVARKSHAEATRVEDRTGRGDGPGKASPKRKRGTLTSLKQGAKKNNKRSKTAEDETLLNTPGEDQAKRVAPISSSNTENWIGEELSPNLEKGPYHVLKSRSRTKRKLPNGKKRTSNGLSNPDDQNENMTYQGQPSSVPTIDPFKLSATYTRSAESAFLPSLVQDQKVFGEAGDPRADKDTDVERATDPSRAANACENPEAHMRPIKSPLAGVGHDLEESSSSISVPSAPVSGCEAVADFASSQVVVLPFEQQEDAAKKENGETFNGEVDGQSQSVGVRDVIDRVEAFAFGQKSELYTDFGLHIKDVKTKSINSHLLTGSTDLDNEHDENIYATTIVPIEAGGDKFRQDCNTNEMVDFQAMSSNIQAAVVDSVANDTGIDILIDNAADDGAVLYLGQSSSSR